MNIPPWSYSSLSTFINCPRQYQLTKVTGKLVQQETEQMRWGTEVHKHLENRVVDRTPLPDHLNHLEPLVAKLMSKGGEITAETKRAINNEFQPCGWEERSAWCRGIVDVSRRNGKTKWVGDWKTGRRRPDSDQLMLFAALEMHHDKALEEVTTSFIWLKEKKMDTAYYKREQLPEIWKHFMPKVIRLETAFEKDHWPARPSGLCGWCPATKQHCEFAKR